MAELHVTGETETVRDTLALVRCMMAGDEQGAEAILAALTAEGRTGDVVRVLADLAADVLTTMGGTPEKMAVHQRGLI